MSITRVLFIFVSFSSVGCGTSAFDFQKPVSEVEEVSIEKSTIWISNPNFADGTTPALVILKLKGKSGRPLKGRNVKLLCSGSNNVLNTCTESDIEGVSNCRVYSTRAELKMIQVMGMPSLEAMATFEPVKPSQNSMSIVAAGDSQFGSMSQQIISSAGTVESPMQLKDSFNVIRVNSSVIGLITTQ